MSDSTIHRLLGHFRTLLEAITVNADRSLSDLPLLTAEERHQLLIEWNESAQANRAGREPASAASAARIPLDGGTTLHDLFEAQHGARPAVSVVCGDERLTYAS